MARHFELQLIIEQKLITNEKKKREKTDNKVPCAHINVCSLSYRHGQRGVLYQNDIFG